MSWADVRIPGTALIAGTALDFDLLINSTMKVDTLTAIRLVIDLEVIYLVSTTVVDSLSMVHLGVGVANEEAFTVGGASLPQPGDPTEYPPRGWLYVNSKAVVQKAESTGVISRGAHFLYDGGAMRKIDKGTLFMRLEQENITVGGAMQVIGRVRVLCKT